MAITNEDVQHVAALARLDLTSEEVEAFRGQLSTILERAQRIQLLPLDDVVATQHPFELRNVLRPDVVVAPEAFDKILENAPEREGPFVKVPRILEDETSG